mgnify:CR=1 FL=1
MSYILEALKKSDQTRKQGNIPDLQTIHVPLTVETQQSRWPYIVIVFLLMGLVFLLGWMRPWQNVPVVESVVSSPLVNEKAKNDVLIERPVVAKVAAENNRFQAEAEKPDLSEPPVAPELQSTAASLEPRLESVPHLQEMSSLIQQAIPDMSFAGHVYSSNPAQRSVIINGSAMAEGAVIMEGLHIDQITSNGVIFNYQTQSFRIDILQDWSFD